MNNNNNIFQYISGGCFLGYAILRSVVLFDGFSWIGLLFVFGCALIAVGLFSSLSVLSVIGSGICSIGSAIINIPDIVYWLIYNHFFPVYLIGNILAIMIWLLLTIYFLNQKNGKFLCFIAGIAQLGDFLFYELNYYGVREVYCNNILRLKDTSVIIIMYLLIAIGAILLGFSSKSVKEHTTHNTKTALNHASSATASTESLAVRLEKLKELLDHGVITQQEFDEKKKQILDS